ncbi:MAG: CHAT domain-containing protein [Gammaproteobacteria bacterium]|nr:CHAT domain-containing protein [Gammaproteobacteria bacterium]
MSNEEQGDRFGLGGRRAKRCSAAACVLIGIGLMGAGTDTTIEALQAERDQYINYFRVHGEFETNKANALEVKLLAVVNDASGELQVRATYELANLQRLTNRFETSNETYRKAALSAESLGLKELAFDAWIGIARAHAFGDKNHGAAADAMRHSIANADAHPNPEQAYKIADYNAQLQAGRGELEAALLNAIDAVRLAQTDVDLFYAQLGVASVLQNFAERCDFRKIIDAKTSTDEGDGWGGCRRAVSASQSYYLDAKKTANRLGWQFLETQVDVFLGNLKPRLFLIDQKASFEKLGMAGVFTAKHVDDVLVNVDFSAGASGLTEYSALADLIAEVAPDADTLDPRSLYLLGLSADINEQPEQALEYFRRAADLLQAERSTLFDPRGRGTVVENRPELVRDLGLRLLAVGEFETAFQTFESIRSRGLTELSTAHEHNRFNAEERKWLSELIQAQSRQDAILKDLVETTIAGVEHSRSIEMLDELDRIEAESVALIGQPEFRPMVRKLSQTEYAPPTLTALQALSRRTNINIVFYWVTHTNVLVWAVGPDRTEVKAVFLPEVALTAKVSALLASTEKGSLSFDEMAARELHTYLIAPFSEYFTNKQVMIVPQGPLVVLPFEALVDAESGSFLVENTIISYAPNASFAARTLATPARRLSELMAVYDKDVELITHEVSKIKAVSALTVNMSESNNLTASSVLEALGEHHAVHVLLHGIYSERDPLQSYIVLNNFELSEEDNEVTASELVAVDWADTRLAVFSSCEGGRVDTRISNEVHGLSWAPMIGGVDTVVVSRWRVESTSNADWMETFYEALAASDISPAAAAATAMRRMIASTKRQPFYWAGPQLFGK